MKLYEKEVFIPKIKGNKNLLEYFSNNIYNNLSSDEVLIRFVVTKTDDKGYYCELGILSKEGYKLNNIKPIFNFRKRDYEKTKKFNAVLLIPTGIGAEIGGHCGDGNAVARLIASSCDTLITHPNVVNASDINELPDNGLYVEGSIITRLLMGQLGLQRVRSNKILVLMDKHHDKVFNDEIVNMISAARATLGISCEVHEMSNIIESESLYAKSGRCVGEVRKLEKLFDIIKKYKDNYDVIGLSTLIKTPIEYHKDYYVKDDMINPWGGVESILTHSIAEVFKIPCAHSPMVASRDVMEIEPGVVDPRKASETSSMTYLYCILKGLYKSPRIVPYDKGLNVEKISCLIIPNKCLGLPTLAALEQGILVIVVRENKNIMDNKLEDLSWSKGQLIIVDNYLEAVGVINAIKSGISLESVTRPINHTKILK